MNDLQMGHPHLVAWSVVGILLAALVLLAAIWRRKASQRFADADQWSRLFDTRATTWTTIASLLMLLAIAFAWIGALDIRWGRVSREVPQRGIEVVFALDVSRSMLAEDVTPNRLERAKQMIKDTVAEMAGDSVGLVIFAGESRQAIPMTAHYDDFRSRLDEISPIDVSRGGSRLGDAIRSAEDAFLSNASSSRAIVMITDGEDMQSAPLGAAQSAKDEAGITIFTIGLGDMQRGARIPDGDRSYVEFNGEQVWSKLDGKILEEIAAASGGAYVPAGTKQVNMADFYAAYLATLEQDVLDTRTVDNYEARFQWFVLPAIILLAASLWPRRETQKLQRGA